MTERFIHERADDVGGGMDDTQSEGARELAEELVVFETHLAEWLETHPEEFVRIHGQEVGGFSETFQEGVDAGYLQWGNVSFLVQQVLEEQPVINMPTPFEVPQVTSAPEGPDDGVEPWLRPDSSS